MWPLIYWIAIAGLGWFASVATLSRRFWQRSYLRQKRPEMLKNFLPVLVRALLLTIGLGFNLAAGVLAALDYGHQVQQAPALLQSLITLLILGGATIFSSFAVVDFWIAFRPISGAPVPGR